ncbi:hypothetical protein [Demequina sp. NBRC 110053]|uniref:hypothetical protein n=1 Tax=Demequina sp. NBRC 110053 TaxID=1570342 RepID=UPI000A016C45|nr:hypothetical protein [Demequina sp. NBRC 110053]
MTDEGQQLSRRERRARAERAASRQAEDTASLDLEPISDSIPTHGADGRVLSRRDRRRLERAERPMETWTAEEEMLATGQIPAMTPERIAEQERIAREKAEEAQREALTASEQIPAAPSDARGPDAADAGSVDGEPDPPQRTSLIPGATEGDEETDSDTISVADADLGLADGEPDGGEADGTEADGSEPDSDGPGDDKPGDDKPGDDKSGDDDSVEDTTSGRVAIDDDTDDEMRGDARAERDEPALASWAPIVAPGQSSPAERKPAEPAPAPSQESASQPVDAEHETVSAEEAPADPARPAQEEASAPEASSDSQPSEPSLPSGMPAGMSPELFAALFPPGSLQRRLMEQQSAAEQASTAGVEASTDVEADDDGTDEIRRLSQEAAAGIDEVTGERAEAAAPEEPAPASPWDHVSPPSAGVPEAYATPSHEPPSAASVERPSVWESQPWDRAPSDPSAATPSEAAAGDDPAPFSGPVQLDAEDFKERAAQGQPSFEAILGTADREQTARLDAVALGTLDANAVDFDSAPAPSEPAADAASTATADAGTDWSALPLSSVDHQAQELPEVAARADIEHPDLSSVGQRRFPPYQVEPVPTGQIEVPPRERPELDSAGGARHFRWAHLLVIGAVSLLIGVVVYNVWQG